MSRGSSGLRSLCNAFEGGFGEHPFAPEDRAPPLERKRARAAIVVMRLRFPGNADCAMRLNVFAGGVFVRIDRGETGSCRETQPGRIVGFVRGERVQCATAR